jgi:hypothetical protein
MGILHALVGRSELPRPLDLIMQGSGYGVAGLRLRLAGTFDEPEAAHREARARLTASGFGPDAYALLPRGGAYDLLAPEGCCRDAVDRARADAALGLEPDWELPRIVG